MTALLFRDDAYLKTATARVVAVHDSKVELDRTIFYPLGGGQPGDTGFLIRDNGERIAVTDTRKGEAPGSVAHVLAAGVAPPGIGETVGLEIDWDRRYALMRLHTALHVMSCVVVAPVTGGNIAPDKAQMLRHPARRRLQKPGRKAALQHVLGHGAVGGGLAELAVGIPDFRTLEARGNDLDFRARDAAARGGTEQVVEVQGLDRVVGLDPVPRRA